MKRAPLPVLIVFAALGGGLGILVRYFFFEQSPKTAGFITGSVSAGLWILIAAAVFLFSPHPNDPVYAAALPEAGQQTEEAADLPDRIVLPAEDAAAEAAQLDEVPDEPVDPALAERKRLIADHARTAASIKEESLADRPENHPEPVRVTIAAIGDMLMHPGVSGSALKEDGTIDYSFIFEPIRAQIAAADIAVVNNEVPFGGNEHGLLNYPAFNVYSELGDAEAEAGFDVILNATNHVRDMGTEGILRTMEFWKKYPEIMSIGINESPEAQQTLHIIERNGVRIALFNYVYGINAGFPKDRPYLIDMMRADDLDKIRAELARAEEEADFTIVFPHWGEEYHLKQSPDQVFWAKYFTECGADLIIGTHPHCLEPVKEITADNGNTSLCYYSLGNYISMQDETISILGGMAKVTLVVDEDGVRIERHGMQHLVSDYGPDLESARVVPLEVYTDEMCAAHGIRKLNLPGNGLNADYPLSIATFYRVIEQVNSY